MTKLMAVELLKNATAAVDKLPDDFKVLGCDLETVYGEYGEDYSGKVKLHIMAENNYALIQYANENGLYCKRVKKEQQDRVYVMDDSGIELMQLVW